MHFCINDAFIFSQHLIDAWKKCRISVKIFPKNIEKLPFAGLLDYETFYFFPVKFFQYNSSLR